MDLLGLPARRALGESRRQCTATNRDGVRCGRWAVLGAYVCASHGGGAPQVMHAAKRRLQALVDPAMEALLRALETAPPCSACGRSDSDRDPNVLKAAQLVLDRVGFHPTVALDVARSDGGPPEWGPYVPAEQLAQMIAWIEEAKARMAAAVERQLAEANGDVIEGAVVDVDTADMGATPPGINHTTRNPQTGEV